MKSSLISVLHIFFLRISRAYKIHWFCTSISPYPFSFQTCDFQVVFGNQNLLEITDAKICMTATVWAESSF